MNKDIDWRTGLYSLKAFKKLQPQIFADPKELKYAAIMLVDADGVTKINDIYSIPIGTQYLCGIVDAFENCGAPQKIGTRRFDGDEFIFLIYGCETDEERERYMEEFLRHQQGTFVKCGDELELELKFSCGYALYPEEGTQYAELNKLASIRMYYDKRQRKRGKS